LLVLLYATPQEIEKMGITKEEAMLRVDEMLVDAMKIVRERAKELLESGAVDLDSWPDTYRLPKALLCAGLEEAKNQYIAESIKHTVKRLSKISS